MPPFRIVADHPGEKGVVHVGGVYPTLEGAQAVLDGEVPAMLADAAVLGFTAAEMEEGAGEPAEPSPGGPGADERVIADPVAHAKALGYELSIVELVPDEMGEDDAGQEIVLTSKWKKAG